MRKSVVCILFFVGFMLSYSPLVAQADNRAAVVQNEQPTIILTVTSDTIQIQNATPGSVMEIYNILGVKVNSFLIDSTEKTISISLPKGYYIIKIGDIVRKIVIK